MSFVLLILFFSCDATGLSLDSVSSDITNRIMGEVNEKKTEDKEQRKDKEFSKEERNEKMAEILDLTVEECSVIFEDIDTYKETLHTKLESGEITEEECKTLMQEKLAEYLTAEQIAKLDDFRKNKHHKGKISKEERNEKMAEILGLTVEECSAIFEHINTYKETLHTKLESGEITKEECRTLMQEKLAEYFTAEQIAKLDDFRKNKQYRRK